MKYIDADKIRAEIDRLYGEYKAKFHQNGDSYHLGIIDGLDMAERILDTLEEPVGKTCKTCGFYENNCPFIRDKFIPYPNKVCKDYTFSTLKAEQEPISEDLEEELERRYEQAKWGYVDGFGEMVMDKEQFTRIARHFAEWGAEHLRESTKKISEDLEEAAEKSSAQYYKDAGYSPFPNVETAAHKSGFIAGAEWQKEQDMDEWLKDRDGCFWDGVNEGKKAMKEQMMEGAVECVVCAGMEGDKWIMTYIGSYESMLKTCKAGDKVKIIIVKEEE